MTRTLSITKSLLNYVLIVVLLVLFANSAAAADNKALKDSFLKFTTASVVNPDTLWRIVQADTQLESFSADEPIIAEGLSNAKGIASLTAAQREAVYAAFQRSPRPLWITCYPRSWQLAAINKNGTYVVEQIDPRVAADNARKQRDLTPLNVSTYTQKGFDSQLFEAAFKNWQQRFARDLSEFRASVKKDPKLPLRLIEEDQPILFRQFFSQSIHSGVKGDHLRKMFAEMTSSRDKRVFPAGFTVAQLLSDENAKPVGYGGTFTDDANVVELWYVVFNNLTGATVADFEESIIFSAFSPAELPSFQTIKRNSWPALVFIRDSSGSVKLYGLSSELARIIERVFTKQIG